MTPVVIFVPVSLTPDQYRREFSDHCRRRRFHVLAITQCPKAVARMYADGRVHKVIVARPEHLAALIADAEVVSQYRQQHLPRQRRTGRRSRRAAGDP